LTRISLLAAFCLINGAVLFPARPTPESVQAHRNRGKAFYERGEYAQAVEEFLKALEAEKPAARDHFNSGMALLQIGDYDRALGAFNTAKQVDPALIDVDFGLGLLYKRQLRYPLAFAALSRVASASPDDPCAWLNLGVVSASMGKVADAQNAFERVLALEFPAARNFYLSALFRQATLLSRQGRNQEAQKLFAEFQALRQAVPGVSLTPQALEIGRHSQIEVPPPAPDALPSPNARPEFSVLTELVFAREPCFGSARPSVAAGDFDRDGLIDLFFTNPCGSNRLFRNRGDGRFAEVSAEVGLGASAAGLGAIFLDYENSGFLSLLVLHSDGNRFYTNQSRRFTDASARSGLGRTDAVAGASTHTLDFDSDGLLDILLTGSRAGGAILFRNNGDGSFRDVSGESGLRAANGGNWRAATSADFDGDGLPDLLGVGERGSAFLLRNLGSGRFRASPVAQRRVEGRGSLGVDALDFNRDGSFDVVIWSERGSRLLSNQGQGRFQAVPEAASIVVHKEGFTLSLDADADGLGDLLWREASGSARLLAYRGRNRFEEMSVAIPRSEGGPAFWADLDGKGSLDIVSVSANGRAQVLRRRQPADPAWLELSLTGEKSNRQAVGATVEVKAGNLYQKLIYRGLPLLIFTGGRRVVDVVRVTWANGVIQNEVQVAANRRLEVVESDRQTSSCPFLYVWDGLGFRFLTEVVGRAPLGEPLPDGRLVQPHPEDYVRIPPGEMKPLEGRHVFQVTEELREVAYLDAVELLAVDHLEGTEIYSNEKFSSPPFEPLRLYPVGRKQLPVAASNERGEDILSLVLSADRLAVEPRPAPVPGFAEEHSLILDPGDISGSSLRLFLTGWVYWPSSSSMRALSTNPALRPSPPALQVKDRSGRWVTVIDDLGLPSGIGRTLVADLTGKFLSAEPGYKRDYQTRAVPALIPVLAPLP